MRRTVTVVTVVASVVAGGALGVGLHTVWDPFDHPFDLGTSTAGPASWSGAPTPGPTADPSPRRTPSVSATPTPTASSADPTTDPTAPAFTVRALLQPAEFVDRGWAVARRIDTFDALPAAAITPCATIASTDDEVLGGFAATSASERTTAAEVVARYADDASAADAYDRLRTEISGCSDSSASPDRLRISGSNHPDVNGVDDLRWWTTRPLGDGPTRGVIGIVRVDDRIALLSLSSDISDPAETTEITSLLTQAGLRLV